MTNATTTPATTMKITLKSKMKSARRFLDVVKRPAAVSKHVLPPTPILGMAVPALPHELPAELWLLILRFTVDDTSSTPGTAVSFLSHSHSHSYLFHRLALHRSLMRFKSHLTLISRAFLPLAQEILYEFIWISSGRQARLLARLLSEGRGGQGSFIRSLHIETPTLERCDPRDLRTILDYATTLEVYSDYRSIQRQSNSNDSPNDILLALAHPNNSLRRLSWTNYDDISFHLHMSPMLQAAADRLEFLELTFCPGHLLELMKESGSSSSSKPDSDASLSPSPSSLPLHLPSLTSLKITLSNSTFHVLSTWSLPSLQNLSVLSADFNYSAGKGFERFFEVHGEKVRQLELGHSSAVVESVWVAGTATTTRPTIPPLAHLCPNLTQFICSADAEWNWHTPDWIAPHILLPSHPKVELIGIRDIDKRLRDDDVEGPYFGLLEQIGSLLRREAFPSLRYVRDMSWESDWVRRGGGAGIEEVEHEQEIGISKRRGFAFRIPILPRPKVISPQIPSPSRLRINDFWTNVLSRCRSSGVWLEDWRGVNVTRGDLKRVRAGLV